MQESKRVGVGILDSGVKDAGAASGNAASAFRAIRSRGHDHSLCISETNPPRTRTSVPVDEKGSCDFETTIDASAATVSWSMSCAWSSGSESNAEGIAHFHRGIFDGTTTMRHSFPNLPTQEYSSAIIGRYVGPCESK